MNIPQSLHDEADWPLWPSVLLVLFLYSVSEFAQNTVCHSSYSQYKYSTVVEGKWPKSSAVTGQKKASHNKSCIFKVLATVIHMTTRWLMSIRIRRIQVGYIFLHPFMYLGQTINSDFILKTLKIQREKGKKYSLDFFWYSIQIHWYARIQLCIWCKEPSPIDDFLRWMKASFPRLLLSLITKVMHYYCGLYAPVCTQILMRLYGHKYISLETYSYFRTP